MISKDLYLIKLSHCISVEGAMRGLICDIQRHSFFIVPRDLCSFIASGNGNRIEDIYKMYGSGNKLIVDEYLNFLNENQLACFSKHKADIERFPSLDLEDYKYDDIDNAIIDIGQGSKFDLYATITSLVSIGCKYLQIRFFRQTDISELLSILQCIEETELENLELILPYCESLSGLNFEEIFIKNQRLSNIIFYNSPFSNSVNYYGVFNINHVEENCNSSSHCGVVHPSYFLTNTPFYIESKKYNTCLNRKVGIDINGEIKNCPSLGKSYGNVDDTNLKAAIEKPGFKDLWDINKDKITICRDCEFRYVCTDCRAYLQHHDDIYSKPLKCGYDPYSCRWEDWSTNPLSKVSITHYNLQPVI